MKPLLLLAAATALAGCQQTGVDRSFVGRVDTTASILSPLSANTAAEPLLSLPVEAGGVLRVREQHFRNGTRQEIVLAGASGGENVLEVSVRTSGGDEAPHGMLQMGKPSQRGIAIETAARFRGVPMMVVTRPMSNTFGPFGLAVGRRENGERCVFAWQWIDDIRGESGGLGGFMSGAAPASVRLRMCRNNMTLDEIAALMEGLRRGDRAGIERLVRMDRRGLDDRGATIAAAAAAPQGFVAPMAVTLESAVPKPAPVVVPQAVAQPAPPPRPRTRVAARPREAARARPARTPAPVAAQSAASVPQAPAWGVPAPMPAGPRYMAPVGADVTSSARPAPPRVGLSGGLPARAYLGPGSGIAY